jgi:hypothetical protein
MQRDYAFNEKADKLSEYVLLAHMAAALDDSATAKTYLVKARNLIRHPEKGAADKMQISRFAELKVQDGFQEESAFFPMGHECVTLPALSIQWFKTKRNTKARAVAWKDFRMAYFHLQPDPCYCHDALEAACRETQAAKIGAITGALCDHLLAQPLAMENSFTIAKDNCRLADMILAEHPVLACFALRNAFDALNAIKETCAPVELGNVLEMQRQIEHLQLVISGFGNKKIGALH